MDLAPHTIDHTKFIDAAISADVKRFIPGELGRNTSERKTIEEVPFLGVKLRIVDYHKE